MFLQIFTQFTAMKLVETRQSLKLYGEPFLKALNIFFVKI